MKRIIVILLCLTFGSSCSFAKKLFQAQPETATQVSAASAAAPASASADAGQTPQSITVETGSSVPESVIVPVEGATASGSGPTGPAAVAAGSANAGSQAAAPASGAVASGISSSGAAVSKTQGSGSAVSGPAVSGSARTIAPMRKPSIRSDRTMDRTERRHLRAERFAAQIDSVISSRNYVFSPNSMQEIPNGSMQLIYADYFYLGIMEDHVEVHLPVVRGGAMQYIQVLNFDTFSVKNYQASRTGCGWNISFDITDDKTVFAVNMLVSTVTGETILTLLTMNNTMRYVGFISNPVGRPAM